MGTGGAAFVAGAFYAAVVEGVLEEGAEDLGLDFFPVKLGGFAQGDEFEVVELDAGGLGEEAAIEFCDAFEAPALAAGIHGGEESAEEVVAIGWGGDVGEELGDEVFGQEVDVFGEEGDEDLEDEALGGGLVHAALAQAAEAGGKAVGSFAGDGDAVVVEDGLGLAGEEEIEGAVVVGKGGEFGDADGGVHLGLEVIDVEFVEVAEDDVAGATGDEAGPVVEGLAVVLGEGDAALFHLDEDDGLPDKVGKGGAAAVFAVFLYAELVLADFEGAGVPEGLEEMVEKDVGLPFFVAGDVGLGPVDEGGELGSIGHDAGCMADGMGDGKVGGQHLAYRSGALRDHRQRCFHACSVVDHCHEGADDSGGVGVLDDVAAIDDSARALR